MLFNSMLCSKWIKIGAQKTRLDDQRDGVISATKIDLHTLPTDILEVFSPLLCEMEEIGTSLDKDEFVDASLRLYETLNVH